jgi:GxxExxY protein
MDAKRTGGEMTELLHKDEVYAIVGAAMEVYNDLGPGFLEGVYQEAMEIELAARNIPFNAHHQIIISYKGPPLKKYYVVDLVCNERVLVEIKALDALTSREKCQLINHLKATRIQVGVLINFGHHPSLQWKRMVFTKEISARPSRTLHEDETIYQLSIGED